MRAIELSPASSVIGQEVERLYRALQLPRPALIVTHKIDDFAQALRLVAAPTEPGARIGGACLAAAVVAMSATAAVLVDHKLTVPAPLSVWVLVFMLCGFGTILLRLGMAGWAGRHHDPLPDNLVCWTVLAAGFLLGGVVGLVLGNPIWAGVGLLGAGAAICISRALGEPVRGLIFRWSCRGEDVGLPLGGGRPIRGLVQPRLRSAVSTALRERGYGMSDPDYGQLDRCIDAIFDRAFPTRQDLWPVLGYATADGPNQPLWMVGRMPDPPILVAHALAAERTCRALTVFDRIAVALLPADPDRRALPTAPSVAAGRALDALLLPWPYPTLARRLPQHWGEKLAAWLIDRERDPILRFAAVERMTPQRLFDALGRKPADRGPEGELYVVGTGVPTMMLRVVDLVPNEDGSERVHWIPVPPHMVKASEAVAWTFGQSPGGYRPSVQS